MRLRQGWIRAVLGTWITGLLVACREGQDRGEEQSPRLLGYGSWPDVPGLRQWECAAGREGPAPAHTHHDEDDRYDRG